MARLMKVDGSIEAVKLPTTTNERLKVLQGLVGGYIEVVPAYAGNLLIVNEEGLLEGLPLNTTASVAVGRQIVGDAVLCTAGEID